MIADVEVGSLLSSGVDSSYVVSEFPGNKTFTVGFLDKQSKYNEIRYAEGLVRELGKNNYNKNIDSEEYFKSIPTVMYYMDEPLADHHVLHFILLTNWQRSRLRLFCQVKVPMNFSVDIIFTMNLFLLKDIRRFLSV